MWQLKDCGGTPPPCNNWFHTVLDEEENKLYLLGGRRVDIDQTVGDFHCFDQSTKMWTDLSQQLQYQGPGNEEKAFPNLFDPALALVRHPETRRPCIFVFSGYDEDTAVVAPNLLEIDLNNFRWSYVNTGGEAGPGRIESTMVYSPMKTSLFIFGGRVGLDEDVEGLNTFSALRYMELPSGSKGWQWTTSEADSPYLQGMGYNLRSLALFGGRHILLTPGRRTAASIFINITSDTILLFDTDTHQFNAKTNLKAPFPRNKIKYYNILETFSPSQILTASIKRPHRDEPRAAEEELYYPSVLFVCHFEDPQTQVLLRTTNQFMEIWQYFVFPEDRIECLELAVRLNNEISAKGFNVQEASMDQRHNGNMILLGINRVRHKQSAASQKSISDSLHTDHLAEEENAPINTPLDRVKYFKRYAEIQV